MKIYPSENCRRKGKSWIIDTDKNVIYCDERTWIDIGKPKYLKRYCAICGRNDYCDLATDELSPCTMSYTIDLKEFE